MAPTSANALVVAHRLLARAGEARDVGNSVGDPVAAGESVSRSLADSLSRWFGPYGYHALLTRALTHARAANPALAAVRVRSHSDPTLDGLAELATAHGINTTTEAIAAVLSAVIELLGRLIGDDMAVNLVEQAVPTSAPEAHRTDNEESQS